MARLKIEYGIDLGTTNSAITRMEGGISTILEIIHYLNLFTELE